MTMVDYDNVYDWEVEKSIRTEAQLAQVPIPSRLPIPSRVRPGRIQLRSIQLQRSRADLADQKC